MAKKHTQWKVNKVSNPSPIAMVKEGDITLDYLKELFEQYHNNVMIDFYSRTITIHDDYMY